MMRTMRIQPAALLLLAGLAFPAHADTLRMLSVGAVKHTVDPLSEEFRQSTGHLISITSATAGPTQKKVIDGEFCDVVVLPRPLLEALGKQGKADMGSVRDLGSVKVGAAIKKGAPKPDIGTLDAFKKTLLATPKLVYSNPASGASSGIHFAKVVKQLGMEEALAAKTIFRQGGTAVAESVAAGEAEIGFTQLSEIAPVAGAEILGPIPAEVQNVTTYSAAACSGTKSFDLARAWIDVMTGTVARERFRKAGFETP
jgi:molybdate transport system substrate-binding protein